MKFNSNDERNSEKFIINEIKAISAFTNVAILLILLFTAVAVLGVFLDVW